MRTHGRNLWIFAVGLLAGFALVAIVTRATAVTAYHPAHATAEGLVGYRDACGGRVDTHTLAVAAYSPAVRCGTRLTVIYRGRRVHVTVLDHGGFWGSQDLDLWRATTRALMGHPVSDAVWGRRSVKIAKGWR